MASLADITNPVMGTLGLKGSGQGPNIMSTSSLSPLQQQLMGNLTKSITPRLGQYTGAGSVFDAIMQGRPSYTANMEQIQERFDPIAKQARQQFKDVMAKNINQRSKNVWSSARQKTLAGAEQDMENKLTGLFSDWVGKEQDKAFQSGQADLQRVLAGMQYSPEGMALQLLGQKQQDTIVNPEQKGLLGNIMGGSGLLGLF